MLLQRYGNESRRLKKNMESNKFFLTKCLPLFALAIVLLFPAFQAAASLDEDDSLVIADSDSMVYEDPVTQAIIEGKLDAAFDMLKDRNPNDWAPTSPNFNRRYKSGWTVLHHAAKRGHSDLCLQIIRYGGSVNRRDNFWNLPFHIAAQYGHSECLATLALKGADLNRQNQSGRTPLHLAVENDMTQAAEALLRLGAKRDIKDETGKIPLDYADTEEMKQLFARKNLSEKAPSDGKPEILWEQIRDNGKLYESDKKEIQELLDNPQASSRQKFKKLLQLMKQRGIAHPEDE